MLPEPTDILADACATVRNVLLPALEDDYAREQAGLLISLLEHVRTRLERETDLLSDDVRDLQETLARAGAKVPEDELSDPRSDQLKALRERDRELSELLQDHLRRAETSWDGLGSIPVELAELRAAVERQLRRQLEIVGPGYALGT